jgi:hypothetical protein
MNRAGFAGTHQGPDPHEVHNLAGEAVEVFLASYGV